LNLMNSLSHSITAQFVMARSPMTFVVGRRPSRAAAGSKNGTTAVRMAISAFANGVKAFPISALRARNQ
jgi:hypothetical protein